MEIHQVNTQIAEKMQLEVSCGYDISHPKGELMCAVGKWLPNHRGFVKYSAYLNPRELHEWLNGYSKRANIYPLDLSKYKIADDLEDKRVSSLYASDLIDFLNTKINGWVNNNIDDLKRRILRED